MFDAKQLRKHALVCLRLEADCTELSKVAPSRTLQSHFVDMAQFWGALAISGPSENAGPELLKARIQTS
jgi:hypothetical protein